MYETDQVSIAVMF